MNEIEFRVARLADVEGIFHVRTAVTENAMTLQQLEEMEITYSSVVEMIAEARCAWVAVDAQSIVGFSMIIPEDGCVFAVFVLPAYEGKGIGTRLLKAAEDELFKEHEAIWLETEKATRGAEFYRRMGWRNEINVGDGDIYLEKHRF